LLAMALHKNNNVARISALELTELQLTILPSDGLDVLRLVYKMRRLTKLGIVCLRTSDYYQEEEDKDEDNDDDDEFPCPSPSQHGDGECDYNDECCDYKLLLRKEQRSRREEIEREDLLSDFIDSTPAALADRLQELRLYGFPLAQGVEQIAATFVNLRQFETDRGKDLDVWEEANRELGEAEKLLLPIMQAIQTEKTATPACLQRVRLRPVTVRH
jgi:hypothetical protein